MKAEDIVIKVLQSLADDALDTVLIFSKGQFIRRYYSLRFKRQIPACKTETLLRTLRSLASSSRFLKYHPERRGYYILDVVELPRRNP